MFWKLRLKLSLLNAAVAGLILLVMAAVAYFITARLITQQSEQALKEIARDVETVNNASVFPSASITIPGAGNIYPYLVLQMNGEMQFAPTIWFGVDLNENQMRELLGLAIASEREAAVKARTFTQKGNGLFFMQRQNRSVLRLSDGQAFRYEIAGIRPGAANIYFIFMDIRRERQLTASVLLALGGSVLGGLALTLLGGLFLAGRALRPIRAAWRKQRNFVADASHELRSPLAAIRCNLDVVLDNPEAQVKDKQLYWEGISEETGRMSVLVDELLLLARADSDAAVLQREKVDLAALTENAVSFMQPLAEKKGVSLKLEAFAPVSVMGDAARLKQVIIALVDNAVKYTPESGGVAVSVRKAKEKAFVDVSDTGIGIAKEHLGKIFERFYRVDKARERETGGYGLGLSIAQWIIEQHGGAISVTSEEGRGSCFTVALGIAKD